MLNDFITRAFEQRIHILLSITSKQMEVFDENSLQTFIATMTQYFSKEEASLTQGMDNAALEAFVVNMIDKAAMYGVNFEDDVKYYILVSLQLGVDFPDEYEWARKILKDDVLMSYEKIDLLKAPVAHAFELKLANQNDQTN